MRLNDGTDMVSAMDSQEKTSLVVSRQLRKHPLTLLDLPIDILQLILNEACYYHTVASQNTY